MKRLIIILLTLFASIAVSAQTNSDNSLKFMGIPVDGSKTQVIQKLKEKGFVYNSADYVLDAK